MHLGGRRFRHIRVEQFLGQGGMGDVYQGFDEKLRRRVALKVLHRRPGDVDLRARLIREAHALSELDHPNICRIYDFIDDQPDVDVLVLELIEGRTLGEVMRKGLPRPELLRICIAIAEVLVTAHRKNILHRDLKPDNIMLTQDGGVKVLDFGLARWFKQHASGAHKAVKLRPFDEPSGGGMMFVDPHATAQGIGRFELNETPSTATAVGIAVGTPLYMSPEQARGEPLTPASDIYSFGLVIQTLLTRKEPYPVKFSGAEVMMKAAMGETLPITSKDRELVALIGRLKQLAPSDRPTASDVVAQLRYIVEKPKRVTRNSAAVAIIALMILGGTKYMIDLRRERSAATTAETEARHRRAQADDLIGFMVGDLRKKLEPVGRLDVLDAAANKALEYTSSLDPATLKPSELGRTAKVLTQLADVRIAQGKLPEAMRALERSVMLAKTAVARDPKDTNLQLQNGESEYWLGFAYRRKADYPHALEHWNRYLSISQQLVRAHPLNDQFQRELSYAFSNVGVILEAQGKLDEALAQYDKSLAIKRLLALNDPSPETRFDLANTTNKVGAALYAKGDLKGARARFDEEQAHWNALLQTDPTHANWNMSLATNCGWRGAVLLDLGETVEARRAYEAEVAIDERMSASDPANVQWKRNLAIALTHVSAVDVAQSDWRSALEKLNASAVLIRQLLSVEARPGWQQDLGNVQSNRAAALVRTGQPALAAAAADEALAIAARLPHPDARTLSRVHRVSGDVAAARGDVAVARRQWQLAVDAFGAIDVEHGAVSILLPWALAQGSLGNASDTRRAVARLMENGYRNSDLQSLCARLGGC